MAVLVRGRSRCPICRRVIDDADEVKMFGPFVLNELDPVHLFSDAALHVACFAAHPLSPEAARRWDEFVIMTGPGKRWCVVCELEIVDPDDFVAFGPLTGDARDPLHVFNYVYLHRTHAPRWPERDRALRELRKALSRGTVRGQAYEFLERVLGES